MPVREIVLPEAKPAWEWVRGRALQKVSPRFEHGIVQGRLQTALSQWAGDRGLYLAAGTKLALLADSHLRTITAIERAVVPQVYGMGRTVIAIAFPDLAIDVAPIFAGLDRFR